MPVRRQQELDVECRTLCGAQHGVWVGRVDADGAPILVILVPHEERVVAAKGAAEDGHDHHAELWVAHGGRGGAAGLLGLRLVLWRVQHTP